MEISSSTGTSTLVAAAVDGDASNDDASAPPLSRHPASSVARQLTAINSHPQRIRPQPSRDRNRNIKSRKVVALGCGCSKKEWSLRLVSRVYLSI